MNKQSFSQFHDGIDWIVVGFSEGLDGFSLGAFSVFHDHLDVVWGESFFWNFFTWDFFSLLGSGGLLLALFLSALGGDWGSELVDFGLTGGSSQTVHVGLSEDNVGIFRSWGFPYIWIINANDEGLSFFDGDSVDSSYGLQSHLGHGLFEFLVSSVGSEAFIVIVMIVITVLSMNMLGLLFLVVMVAVLSMNVLGWLFLVVMVAVLSMNVLSWLLLSCHDMMIFN